jgi:hypothetical protein
MDPANPVNFSQTGTSINDSNSRVQNPRENAVDDNSDPNPHSNRSSTLHTSESSLIRTGLEHQSHPLSTKYETIPIPIIPSQDAAVGRISLWIRDFRVPDLVFQLSFSIVLPLLVWLAVFVTVGDQNFPGGSVFVIVILEFLGRISGTNQ